MTWRELSLGSGIHIKHGLAFKSRYFTDNGDHIVLTPGNFHEAGGFRLRPGKDRSYGGEIPEGFVLQRGDLIVAMTEQAEGLLGSAALIPEDDRFLHNQRLGLVTEIDPGAFNSHFLYYLFNSQDVRSQIASSASGTKVRHTAPKRIYRVKVRVPDVPIQERIAATLRNYDDLIENNRRRIQLLEQSARLLYKEWFVHLRFPGHEHVSVVDGVPKGWRSMPLGEVAQINSSSISTSYQGEIEYVDISSVSTGRIDNTVRLAFKDAPSRARRVVQHGDIIWSCVRPNRQSHAIIWNSAEDLVVSTGFAVISPSEIPTSYLYQAITTPEFVGYLSNNAQGAAYPAVKAVDFENAMIICPRSRLLEEFDQAIAPTIDQSHFLQQQSMKLARARDVLLPRLMSGEIPI